MMMKKNHGIVRVTPGTTPTEANDTDPVETNIARMLKAVPRFEPFLKTSLDPPTTPSLFSWGSSIFSGSSRRKNTPFDLSASSLDVILYRIHQHARSCAQTVADEQQFLSERITAFDEYCAKLSNTISNRTYQARQVVDSLNRITSLRRNAETTRGLLLDIKSSLQSLDQFLDPVERLDHPDNARRYPKLLKVMKQQAVSSPAVSPNRGSGMGDL